MISESDKPRLLVGYKQTVRALNEMNVDRVYLAENCEGKIKGPIEDLCGEKNVSLMYMPDMKELGKMCGIEVKASCAAVLV